MSEQIVDLLKKRFPKYKHRDRYYEQVAQEILDSLKHECEWVNAQGNFSEVYDTSCGEFYSSSEKHDFTHCPYCGGEIKEKA